MKFQKLKKISRDRSGMMYLDAAKRDFRASKNWILLQEKWEKVSRSLENSQEGSLTSKRVFKLSTHQSTKLKQ
jgi:hypothetical protein